MRRGRIVVSSPDDDDDDEEYFAKTAGEGAVMIKDDFVDVLPDEQY